MSVVAHFSRWRFSAVGSSGTAERQCVFLSEGGGTCCGALQPVTVTYSSCRPLTRDSAKKCKTLQEHPTGESL